MRPLALGLAAAWLIPREEGAGGRDAPPPRERLRWGIYQIHWGVDGFTQGLDRELPRFASGPDWVMFYRDLGRPYPRASCDEIRRRGAVPLLSLELWHWGRGRREASRLPAIATGEYDRFFRQWARDALADGGPVLLRFGFEMNGDWFPWSGDPELYVRAWRRAHGLFREEGATNVAWVWSPNVVSAPDTTANSMHRYYPGNDVVDWVALDGYNFGDHHDAWHRWQSFAEVFAGPLDDLEARYPEKPVLIAETACAPGDASARARWIREAHAWLLGRPRVKGLVWFHYDKSRQREPDWRIDATPGALEAFNGTFAAAR